MRNTKCTNLELQRKDRGFETLSVVAVANKFNSWVYDTIQPYCTGKMLEIGSGIGNISEFLLRAKFNVTLSDFDEQYCKQLRDRFLTAAGLDDVICLDIVDKMFSEKYHDYFSLFDSIVLLNVIEHVDDDALAIRNCWNLLKQDGNMIIVAPAYSFLYNRFDSGLQHRRRYRKKSLSEMIVHNGFEIIASRYFNAAGIVGWYVSGKLERHDTIPESEMKFFNTCVPIVKLIDVVLRGVIGLSVFVVAKKMSTERIN